MVFGFTYYINYGQNLMIKWGMVGNSHDASLAVFDNNELLWAGQSKVFSNVPHDPDFNWEMLQHVTITEKLPRPNKVIWYERPLLKTFRQWRAGQGWLYKKTILDHISRNGIYLVKLNTHNITYHMRPMLITHSLMMIVL